jgi:hypothetical protein
MPAVSVLRVRQEAMAQAEKPPVEEAHMQIIAAIFFHVLSLVNEILSDFSFLK